jgi:hypothetical protein
VSLRLSLVLALLFGVLVAYLASLNTSGGRVTLGGGLAYRDYQPSWFDRCPSCRSWNTSRA